MDVQHRVVQRRDRPWLKRARRRCPPLPRPHLPVPPPARIRVGRVLPQKRPAARRPLASIRRCRQRPSGSTWFNGTACLFTRGDATIPRCSYLIFSNWRPQSEFRTIRSIVPSISIWRSERDLMVRVDFPCSACVLLPSHQVDQVNVLRIGCRDVPTTRVAERSTPCAGSIELKESAIGIDHQIFRLRFFGNYPLR